MVKKNKRQQNIKTKLMAAVCMLLVSSIMMVSTTYAWFTLSTAPEVTGINTAVGANGNLEIALLPLDGDASKITSSAGDSAKDWSIKNTTWGNLVDVSDNTTYGLDKITLFPSALNVAVEDDEGNPVTLAETLLVTPAYGADGRVSELLANTVTSTYDSTEANFPQNTNYGVRGVGTASGMTDRELAYRNARSAASTAMAQAKTFASQSLNTNGAALANVAMAHGVDANATHTQEDVASLKAIVTDLLGDDDTTGVLEYIEQAYIQYIYAYAASGATGADDTAYLAIKSKVEGGASLDEVLGALTTAGVSVAAISTPTTALAATKAQVESALTDLNALTGDEITWAQISTPLYKLADTDAMEINGIKVSEIKEKMSDLVSSVTGGAGLNVTIATGGGVYADVADHCGNFNAQITIAEVSYGGVTLNNMPARMSTATTMNPVYLAALGTAVEAAGAPPRAEGTTLPITDLYGYIIDLAFRTNAAESNLLLQAEGINRIYGENGSEETMGHGATMTFQATTTDFTEDMVKGLMGAIRIVFFNPDDRSVLATAKLDGANAVSGVDGLTAEMYLYTISATTNTTYEAITAGQTGTHISDGAGGYRPITDGETGTHVEVIEKTGVVETKLTDNVITALTQNQAQKVSVLVYLDGNSIQNADVAATAATSMTGTMNLQFASSATLVPMNYTPFLDPNAGNETTEAAAATTVAP